MSLRKNTTIQSLQVFRGIAALAVVMVHSMHSTLAFSGPQHGNLIRLFNMGYLGVDFFFVLSGFIIMHAHINDFHEISAMKVYIFKRLVRIYPTYLPIGMLIMVLYTLLPTFTASGGHHFSFLSSFLLIPLDLPPALNVAWTLIHELMFYIVFMLFFVSIRWLFFGLALWAIFILGGQFYNITGWLKYPLNLINIEFMIGLGSAYLLNSKMFLFNRYKTILVIVGISITFSTLIIDVNPYPLRLISAFGLSLIIIGVSLYEIAGLIRWPIFSLLIGNASYSIYLIHNPLLSFTQRIFGKLHLEWYTAFTLGILISLCAGLLYYFVIERSCVRFFKRYLINNRN
ncbi:MAG: acyltransferase [Sphingobacteriaceae bacterium]|nr:acyltransferase [Sphingobacteriaceae bacterium]